MEGMKVLELMDVIRSGAHYFYTSCPIHHFRHLLDTLLINTHFQHLLDDIAVLGREKHARLRLLPETASIRTLAATRPSPSHPTMKPQPTVRSDARRPVAPSSDRGGVRIGPLSGKLS